MADPVTYNFYGTTVPTLRNIAQSAISILTTAQDEISAAKSAFPSEQELLDTQFADMFPFRMQPILLTKFPVEPLTQLSLHGSVAPPALNPGFTSLTDVIEFFKATIAVYDAIEEKAFNEAADKSVDVEFKNAGKTLHMKGFADYYHGFCVPNAYFHLNAMYMLLRSRGFKLGKTSYIGAFMSEQQKMDWAPLKG
ncbi:hypothetical protein HBH56_129360 [Parastagonospora nodorum]|uniref:Uncharacterized protein n=2 Tax=Phaeosphaeria nodorum (strain SN15 / ATCC MYA-4574 / FGSC 10173) TaxID=321614 RepID=A0A7U2I997_PHANO|nr:hypothetical protein SNOG_05880 [Parastagonospora nodorum SN15]KAH3911847.1 hypothetical protein HBH56_129360 [Parastagonospora nodorum]EAT86944.1 hypothetical protein SNOG_05880 [Parastagonospora nodorum SN15]KAH3931237.1 hypothetical protein HBH54_094110 [Parastagonospora nodorum]KAH3947232.1 hypothetical protein HBH53_119640 [Parastagonospora nodorum]KAH3971554.1 hypothetical protein HBH52_158330 [Parastagonospora nodorum]